VHIISPAPALVRRIAVTLCIPAVLLTLVTGGAVAHADDLHVEREPTQAEMNAARAKVAELADQEQAEADSVSGQRQALTRASQRAGLALEGYTVAVRRLGELQRAESAQQDRLARATEALEQNRGELGRWAREAYQGGGMISTHVTLNALLTAQDSGDVATNLAVLRRIGTERTHALDATQTARTQQESATQAAASASQQAAGAAVDAASARDDADQALADQRAALGQAQAALSGTRSDLDKAKERQNALQAAQLLAAASRGVAASGSGAATGNRVTGAIGSCAGGDVGHYANGQIPVGSLCPLTTAPGHHLRADAAYAFDRLSNSFAQRFGTPICVTDSYRSLAAQIDVFARKPGLAARPGTSNHGWGTATDLCGGIQSFSTAQHHWMQVNAPLYGWFHPAWAEPSGSKPEPWHWEFAG